MRELPNSLLGTFKCSNATQINLCRASRLEIKGDLTLCNATFRGVALFDGARVEGVVDVTGTRFKKDALFQGLHVGSYLVCSKTRFESEASFERASVVAWALFDSTSFHGEVHVSSTNFGELLAIANITFERDVELTDIVAGTLRVEHCRFISKTSFRQFRCDRDVSLDTCEFAGELRAYNMQLAQVSLTEVHCHSDSRFVGIHIDGNVSLENCSFAEPVTIHGPSIERSLSIVHCAFHGRAYRAARPSEYHLGFEALNVNQRLLKRK
jgi:hypothetical protein